MAGPLRASSSVVAGSATEYLPHARGDSHCIDASKMGNLEQLATALYSVPKHGPAVLPALRLPQFMHPAIARPMSVLGRLSGKCLIALGDSTMGETVTELGVLLGAMSDDAQAHGRRFEYIKRVQGNKVLRNGSGNPFDFVSAPPGDVELSGYGAPGYAQTTRMLPTCHNMTIASDAYDARVYYRFSANPNINSYYAGLVHTVGEPSVQQEIARMAAHVCAGRERVVWAEDAYHSPDVDSKARPKLVAKYKVPMPFRSPPSEEKVGEVLSFIESLAPRRLWLRRHTCTYNGNFWNVTANQHRWKRRLQARSARWQFVDYSAGKFGAWQCEARLKLDDAASAPMHPGAGSVYWVHSTPDAYLGFLRTWQAIFETTGTAASETDSEHMSEYKPHALNRVGVQRGATGAPAAVSAAEPEGPQALVHVMKRDLSRMSAQVERLDELLSA